MSSHHNMAISNFPHSAVDNGRVISLLLGGGGGRGTRDIYWRRSGHKQGSLNKLRLAQQIGQAQLIRTTRGS